MHLIDTLYNPFCTHVGSPGKERRYEQSFWWSIIVILVMHPTISAYI